MKKSPTLAFLLSVFPGIGHIYAKGFWGGALAAFIYFTLVCIGILFMIIPGVLIWIICAFDAARVASNENKVHWK
jgi:uncharacterized iron-regulated membrane protein